MKTGGEGDLDVIAPALQAEEKGKDVAALAAEQGLGNFCHDIFHGII